MNRVKKICRECGKMAYIYSKGRCKGCAVKGYARKIKEGNKGKHEADKAFYMEIWNTRAHICEYCGAPIHEPRTFNFHHIRAKAKHPELRYKASNIALLCLQCHSNEHT